MIVQWCLKGVHLQDDDAARDIIDSKQGLQCNWWRNVHRISPPEIRAKLTPANLDRHVNHFNDIDPATGRPFREMTPFVSLSAGTVERDKVMQTNVTHTARETALGFGSGFGTHPTAYVYKCWVIVAPRQAVKIEGVAEEVRELTTYRSYSAFQLEGEVVAKIDIPDNQIEYCERWDMDNASGWQWQWRYTNAEFSLPSELSNVRELI